MEYGDLPAGLERVRTTDELTAESVPAGLLRAHRVADGVWGRLHIRAGRLRFVWEDLPVPDSEETSGPDPRTALDLVAGDAVVIPPGRYHHVEPGPGARFVVEFHR